LLFLSRQKDEIVSNCSFKLFQDYADLINILHQINNQDENIFKFIYYYRNNIHALLYDCNENIKINEFKLKFDLDELFYLDLLIAEKEENINYTYDFDLLLNIYKNLVKSFKVGNNNFIYKIVACKILLDLIKNFCDSDNYDEIINEEKVNKINNEIENEFQNGVGEFKKVFNINNKEKLSEKKIGDLFCQIIISLIKSNKFNDYNYLYTLIDLK
jgi:translation initiation factor 2 alpha subunit (eIF-2alpha)